MGIKETAAKNIRYFRQKKGLTQDALAKKLRVEVQFLNRLEKQPQNMSLETLGRVARALGVHPSVLLSESETVSPGPLVQKEINVAIDAMIRVRDFFEK